MQVITGIRNDGCHYLDGPGAYEWWYADALSDDGEWGVVIILFRGMPMSPTYLDDPEHMLAGCAVSVYHNGVRLAFSFTEQPLESASYARDEVRVQMDGASIVVDETGLLTACIDMPCDTDERRVAVTLRGQPTHCIDPLPADLSDKHAWVLARPRMQTTASIQLMEGSTVVVDHTFETTGYHDHNLGVRAMHHDFAGWYWGRVHCQDRTIVFLSTPRSGDTTHEVYEIDVDGVATAWHDVEITYGKTFITAMGLLCSRHIRLRGISPTTGPHEVSCTNSIACEDSPFYQRYISDWFIDGTAVGKGMSEYMNVARMKSAWIRPFLRLPLINILSQVER
jgi:carotenoid 1,2-hydratase